MLARVLATLSLVVAAATSRAAEPPPRLIVQGNSETVFEWRTQRCDDQDIPDAPARAFRDGRGTVHLFAAHFVNRALTGRTLEEVTPNCRTTFVGGRKDDPAAFDDRIWLTSFYTRDGTTIHALGHAEYHGHLRHGCAGGRYMDCWWNAVVQVVSTDGGATFRRAGPDSVVAASPYPYDGAQRRPTGYFSPSNIVEHDGSLFVFVFAAAQGGQQRGACLLRTDEISEPGRWRAWNGSDFTVRLSGAYAQGRRTEDLVCAPVPGIPSTLTSLTRQPDGAFVGLFAASRPVVPGGAAVTGVYAITSRDLLRWSEPALLLAVPMMFDFPCTAAAVYAYPSLLDPQSAPPTFTTIGTQSFLYMTRFNVRGCRLGMDRDLVRFRVVPSG